MLRPADCVTEGCGAFASGVTANGLRHSREQGFRDSANLLNHLGGVARVVAFEDLEHAPRVLQRGVVVFGLNGLPLNCPRLLTGGFARSGGRFGIDAFVHPGTVIVGALFLIPPAEQSVVVFGVLELARSR